MVAKSPFRNEHVEAYLEGRFDEIPVDVMELVKVAAERRNLLPSGKIPVDPREVLAKCEEPEEE